MSNSKLSPTGVELIAAERQEQIEKHGFTKESDARYGNQLVKAANFCLTLAEFHNENCHWPEGWDNKFAIKIASKSTVGKLTVAGAFLMADNERRGDDRWNEKIASIAATIDHLNQNQTDHE